MSRMVVVDTTFLISLVDESREAHEAAKKYYRYFLENGMAMLLPTVVVAEFCVKQPITDLPLRNFRVIPFNFEDAQKCGYLNAHHSRKDVGVGQRDAVKDDFKIIAQTVVQDAALLITEDGDTLGQYCSYLRERNEINFKVVNLHEGFDVSCVNEDGGLEMNLES
ncbi:MAG: hypothetical protein KJ626_00015 [Verrucomicrobia bacterium]|nr:hypothetical protein [Verrucomicrobiota bacterium]